LRSVRWSPTRIVKPLRSKYSRRAMENLRLALEARERFPWAKEVPERIFLNEVLPYASLDEPRANLRQSTG